MAISIPGRTIVFDYGEVISHSPSEHDRAALLAVTGLTAERAGEFWDVYWRHREGLDQGSLGRTAYWRLVAGDLGVEWDAATIQRLWAADVRSWISADPAAVAIIADLREGGTATALLSNAGPDFGSLFRCSPLGELIGPVFVSGEMDLVKPDPAIYRAAAEGLGVPVASLVFIDNKAENVAGALAAGVGDAHVYTSPRDLRAFLATLVGDHPLVE